jgi:DNA-binding NarL/FixJ family response regulator
MKKSILLYDDNENLGNSLSLLLNEEPDLNIIAYFPSAIHITDDVTLLKPDVVLMDIDMPEMNGVEAVKKIRKINQHLPIIMLTIFEDNDNIFNAICAGASGYILKKNATEELADAIRSVLNGGAPMTGVIARKVLQMVPQQSTDTAIRFNLSPHEKEVLKLLVEGGSYKMIASQLNVSIDTVRFHIKKIYDKLHVHSATEAVSVALKNKLVSLLF